MMHEVDHMSSFGKQQCIRLRLALFRKSPYRAAIQMSGEKQKRARPVAQPAWAIAKSPRRFEYPCIRTSTLPFAFAGAPGIAGHARYTAKDERQTRPG